MSEIPTGSLKPDSPSRIVRARWSRRGSSRSTEYTAAGSVGASAIPPEERRQRPLQTHEEMRGGGDRCCGRRRSRKAKEQDRTCRPRAKRETRSDRPP